MCGTICHQILLISIRHAHLKGQLSSRPLSILEMFLALVILFILFYIMCWVCLGVCMYGQLLVLVIQPLCSSSLSYVHVFGLYLCFISKINSNINNNNNNNNNKDKLLSPLIKDCKRNRCFRQNTHANCLPVNRFR